MARLATDCTDFHRVKTGYSVTWRRQGGYLSPLELFIFSRLSERMAGGGPHRC